MVSSRRVLVRFFVVDVVGCCTWRSQVEKESEALMLSIIIKLILVDHSIPYSFS
jgi:hypothetical protein